MTSLYDLMNRTGFTSGPVQNQTTNYQYPFGGGSTPTTGMGGMGSGITDPSLDADTLAFLRASASNPYMAQLGSQGTPTGLSYPTPPAVTQYNASAPTTTASSSPLSLQQWFDQTGTTSRGDDGGPDQPAYARYLEDFYTSKYGLTAPSMYNYDARVAGEYEQMLGSFDPSAKGAGGTYSELPSVNMSPERIQQIMQGAFNTGGNFNQAFTGQLNPEEANVYKAFQAWEAPEDNIANMLQMAMLGGFGALVAPSIIGSLGDAGFSNPFSSFGSGGGAGGGAGGGGLSPQTLSWMQSAGYTPEQISSIGSMFGADGALLPAITNSLQTPPTGGGFGGAGTDEAGAIGGNPELASGASSVASGGLMSRILDGTATADDWLKLAGTAGSTLLGVVGGNRQTDALKDVYNTQLGLGAPYRDLLQKSYQPGFTMENEPGYKAALDSATDAYTRMASAGKLAGAGGPGNPIGNPGAWAETLKRVNSSVSLPALQSYRAGLAGAGQLDTQSLSSIGTNAALSSGNSMNAIGAGLADLVNPKSSLEDLLKLYGGFQTTYA